jgi:peptide/nickel transport system substrate-binding protein
MVEAEEVSADGLTWTFRLRPGLKFHDGEPVLASDAVASINRWSAREPMGQMLKAIENELIAVDDRTFRWVLKKPYPKMLLALGKISTPCCFVMPARIAATDPFKQINEYVGMGPCASSGTSGSRAQGRYSSDLPITCRARKKFHGLLAENGSSRTASSGL